MKTATSERAELLDKAAKSLSRGELDAALKLYLRVFDDDPHDWTVGNTLGDLYIKTGRAEDAVSHFTMLAEQLAADGFAAKARALYRKIVRLQPDNADARKRVDELDRQGSGETSPFLKRVLETARTLKETTAPPPQKAPPTPPQGDAWATHQPAVLPPPAPKVPDAEFSYPVVFETAEAPPPPPRRAAHPPASAEDPFAAMENGARAAVAKGDYRNAAWIIERFLTDNPDHVLALEHLIDVCVDGELVEPLASAQQRLVEACLLAGHHRQAFDVALDLSTRDPQSAAHRALVDRVVAVGKANGKHFVVPSIERPPVAPPVVAAPEPVVPPPVAPPVPPPPVAPQPVAPQPVAPQVAAPRPPPKPTAPLVQPPPEPPVQTVVAPIIAAPASGGAIAIGPPFGDLLKEWSDPDRPLETIRDGLLEDAVTAAEEGFEEAARLIDARQYAAAIPRLEDAMCLPYLRAAAGSRLARVLRDTGEPVEALAVLETAAELPPEDEESGHELAYELALTLEALGQDAQALGVYRELVAEVGPNYRDVAIRVERLAAA